MILYYDIIVEKSRKKIDHHTRDYPLIAKSNGWGIRCGGGALVLTGSHTFFSNRCHLHALVRWHLPGMELKPLRNETLSDYTLIIIYINGQLIHNGYSMP